MPEPASPDLIRPRRAGLIVVAVLLAIAIGGAVFLRTDGGWALLRDQRAHLLAARAAHPVGAAFVFLLTYALLVALSLPGATAASLTGGFLFGGVLGTALNVTAAGTGAIGVFLAAKWGIGEYTRARLDASERTRRWMARLRENEWSALFVMRFLPVVPFFIANLLPALTGVRLSRFVLSTYLGIIPGAAILSTLGAGLGDALDRGGGPDLTILHRAEVLLPLLALATLALLPVFLRRGR